MIQHLRDNYDEEILTADGFDAAFIGVAEIACRPIVAAYDYQKCVEILMAGGMEEEDAHEHMSFNVTGASVGEYTPVFIHDWRKEEEVLEYEVELEEVNDLSEQLRLDKRREAVEKDKRGQE
jgi:hypothetical protein